jgi:hypothetical protein
MDWAYSHDKTAVAVICGQHDARSSIDVAKKVLRKFIVTANTTKSGNDSDSEEDQKRLFWCTGCVVGHDGKVDCLHYILH